MKNKQLVLGSIFVLVVGFLGLVSVYNSSQSSKLSSYQNKNEAPFVRDHSVQLGQNENQVTVVEFLDPQCEACAFFHPFSKRIFNEYEKEVRWTVRYLDNHGNSKYVIKVLEASRLQKKYNEVLDIIFDTQPLWSVHGSFKPNFIWESLKNIEGLDINKLRKDFDEINVDEMLSLDRKDANALNVRGTPSFFVNGVKLEKLSYEGLLNLVESQIYK